MKPNFLNRFMKKLTRERVVPTISAKVFLADLGHYGFRNSLLAEMRQQ
jgi:hypothetical protein